MTSNERGFVAYLARVPVGTAAHAALLWLRLKAEVEGLRVPDMEAKAEGRLTLEWAKDPYYVRADVLPDGLLTFHGFGPDHAEDFDIDPIESGTDLPAEPVEMLRHFAGETP